VEAETISHLRRSQGFWHILLVGIHENRRLLKTLLLEQAM